MTTPTLRLTVWLGLLALTVLGYHYGSDREVLSREAWVFDPEKPFRLRLADVGGREGLESVVVIGVTGEARFYRRNPERNYEQATILLSQGQIREIGWAVEAHRMQRLHPYYMNHHIECGGRGVWSIRQAGREQMVIWENFPTVSLPYFWIYLEDVVAWTTPILTWVPMDRPAWYRKIGWGE